MVFDAGGVVKRSTANQIGSQIDPGNTAVLTDGTVIIGNGKTGNIIRLSQQGANTGQILLWNGTNWIPGNTNSFGDIKSGIQSSDHNGWIKLDGRLKSTLTATQQARATTLGIGTNLPDANNAFLVQNGTSLGSLVGSNSKVIAQNQLPNVQLNGTTNSTGNHTHNYTYTTSASTNSGGIFGGSVVGSLSETGISTSSSGNHSHTITTDSINGGVTQQSLDVTPRSLSVNMFIYLGN